MNSVFVISIAFAFGQLASTTPAMNQHYNCTKGFRYFSKVQSSFSRGVFLYPAKEVVITADSRGNPIYNVKKRNKEISYLNKLTEIVCVENKEGAYILTIDILKKWENWFTENCNLRKPAMSNSSVFGNVPG